MQQLILVFVLLIACVSAFSPLRPNARKYTRFVVYANQIQ